MHRLRSAGVDVPGEISIVGYDDIPMAALPYIDVTTVGQDAHKTAQLAVERAIARLGSRDSAGHEVLVPPYLVVRGTTRPPKTTPCGT
jgi:DNA-binding LacI/PurR family transcriptional regulator